MKHEQRASSLEHYRNDLSRCVKCGACRAVCTSFLQEQQESFSARGRMALIQAVMDGRLTVSAEFQDRLATCTGCLACETACPSRVPVTAIIRAAREHALRETGPGLIRSVVSTLARNPLALQAAAWFAPMALHSPKRQGNQGSVRKQKSAGNGVKATTAGMRRKVVFFPGCADFVRQDINAAACSVLGTLGYDVVVPSGFTCCGGPLLSLGDQDGARECALQNSSIFARLQADVLVTACATCGLTFKRDYPTLLPPDAKSPAVLDIHELLVSRLAGVGLSPVKKRVTWHDPCHLGRGQGLSKTARDILRAVPGLTLIEMKNPDSCCGFGGVMRLTHPGFSRAIARKKAENIIATNADAVATGCPGCALQLADALKRLNSRIEVVHTVQILEESLAHANVINAARAAGPLIGNPSEIVSPVGRRS